MKMGFWVSGVAWGSFFILLGLSVILKHTLHINIPVVQIFLGVFLIYLGAQIIAGGFGKASPPPAVVFDQGKVSTDGKSGEYNVIFGKGIIDLTDVEVKDKDVFLKANTIFGSSTVKLKAETPVLVRANSAFGNLRLPNGNAAALGSCLYKGKNYQEGKPHLELEVNTVFGETQVEVE